LAIKKFRRDWRPRIFMRYSLILIENLFVQVGYTIPYFKNQQLERRLRDIEYTAISTDELADYEHIQNFRGKI